jgi:hypothetical protein
MAFRFNSGRGGVTCDNCNVLIDQDLSYKEYEELYGHDGNDGDFCMKCKDGSGEKRIDEERFKK